MEAFSPMHRHLDRLFKVHTSEPQAAQVMMHAGVRHIEMSLLVQVGLIDVSLGQFTPFRAGKQKLSKFGKCIELCGVFILYSVMHRNISRFIIHFTDLFQSWESMSYSRFCG